jgi:membrane-bound lytic murein transglycosylase B
LSKSFHLLSVAFAVVALHASAASAATCGSTGGGFENWKQQFSAEAKGRGAGAAALSALATTHYNAATISADRGQHSFALSFEQFMAKRGGATIISRGRSLKASQAAMFASIEQRYGVPAGPLLAIWGMETGFGAVHGNQHALSAVATLAYDCRRSAFFTEHLNAALQLIDRGALSPQARGSMHGEIGQTQFMPKNILLYGAGANLESSQGALSATANFLKAHGWRAGAGYQPGEPSFGAIQEWNAATVYQRAIAHIGKQIDGGGK